MKTIKTILQPFILLLLSITTLASCNKKNEAVPQQQSEIVGSWQETMALIRVLEFKANGDFSLFVRTSGESGITIFGTYTIKGDSLKIHATRKEKIVTGKPVIASLISSDLFYEKCTFKVKDGMLSLQYTTYPADAPVATQATFTRIIKTDY